MDPNIIARPLATLLCAIALGGMVFFAAFFAPLIFRKLSPEVAGNFIREVFPVYYLSLILLMVLATLLLWNHPEAPVLAAIALLFLFARFGLMPRINQARDASTAGDQAEAEMFVRLHHLSVIINVAQMAALVVVFVRLITY